MATAEDGGRAVAVSGDRQKLNKVLREQGMSQAQIDSAIQNGGNQGNSGRRGELWGHPCWITDSKDTPGGLDVKFDPGFDVTLS